MDLANLSIKRPVFVTCVSLLIFALGLVSMGRIGVDLFPDVTFPVVTVTTPYLGAGPQEIETLVSKPLEDEISGLPGLKRLSSINQDGSSSVVAEFELAVDIKVAEQQIRDRVGSAKHKLPRDIEEPIIRRIDPANQPVLVLGLQTDLPEAKLFDLMDQTIRPELEQVNQVGLVEIMGAQKREIRVVLDRKQLREHEISASQVVRSIEASGENVPAGKIEEGARETLIRTMAEFRELKDIESVIVNFFANDVPVRVRDLATIEDSLVDKKSETYVNGKYGATMAVFKQSGANTLKVTDALLKRVDKINERLAAAKSGKLQVLQDASMWIRWNITDVQESIFLGVLLAVLVVYMFLGSIRSTIITGLALPNSLVGAFLLMAIAGFTVNVMSLLALSLSVGLLVDDAIVVRENIFRHLERGKSAIQAAIEGTGEVRLAVIATTLTVIAVFGPVAGVAGVIGQFLKEFGLTVCFAMAISLFDALTIAPMLSAYFAGVSEKKSKNFIARANQSMLAAFDRLQLKLEDLYDRLLKRVLRSPWKTLGASVVIFLVMMSAGKYVPKTFLPPQDGGEFEVKFELPPGSSLEAMRKVALEMDVKVRENKEVLFTALTVGNRDAEPNIAKIYVRLVPSRERKYNTSEFKDIIRAQMEPYKYTNPRVVDFDAIGAGMRPFNINILGSDQEQLEAFTYKLFERLKSDSRLKDVDVDYRKGKPEFRINLEKAKAEMYGIAPLGVGQELRAQLEGMKAAKFRQGGLEYDVRVRLKEDQRNLKNDFDKILIPNVNRQLIPLKAVAKGEETQGPAKITRQNRSRYININADITPGQGMGDVMADIQKWFQTDMKLPDGVSYAFVGQAENFQEMGTSMATAFGLGILFIFLVLASLYESFLTPFTIMLALPLAICGAIVGLLIGKESINIYSLLGMVMLLGVASKNSILLVDHAMQKMRGGMDAIGAMLDAGRTRLRPILMTTMALIAGSIPIAIGLNEASKQRTSMGVGIVGGLVSSTALTLVVVPAAFILMEKFKKIIKRKSPTLEAVEKQNAG